MATTQTEEATDNKPESVESGTVQESSKEKAEPKEPAATEAPADEAVPKQDAEEKAEVKPETTDELKAEPETKTEAVEENDKPEAEAKQETEEKAESQDNTNKITDSKESGTAVESQILDLSTESFKAFCSDMSAMFSIGMKCDKQEAATVTIEALKERFKNLLAITSIKADGTLEGTFQIILSREGLFTLAGAIAMPAQMTSLLEKCIGPEKTMKNIKSGSLKEAEEVSDTVAEACNLLIGSWDRIFREGLEGHKHLLQTNTFIGDPWDNPKEKIGLSSDEEYLFAPHKITISSFPAFDCGAIFPKTFFGKVNAEAEEKAKAEAEEKAKAEAEEKAKVEAEEKAKAEAEEKAKAEAEEKAKTEAEEKAKVEAEEKAKAEAEEKAKAEAEEKAKAEAEEKAKAETKEQPKTETEAKQETEVKTEATADKDKPKAEAEEKTEANPETTGEPKAEPEAENKAEVTEEKDKPEAEAKQEETEEKAETKAEVKGEAEEKTEAKPETTDEPKAEPEAENKAEATEEKDKPEADAKQEETEEKTSAPDQNQEPPKGKISETIQKMSQSPAILPGESGKATMGHINVSSKICATDIMQKELVWATSEESVQQAMTKMQQQDSGYIMIGKDGILEGIVSKSDITGATSIYLRPIFAKWYGPLDDATLQIKLKWIMSRPVRTVSPETPLVTIIENICRFGGRGLPVVDEQGKVQGLVTVFDIFRTLLNTSENVSVVGKTAEAPVLT